MSTAARTAEGEPRVVVLSLSWGGSPAVTDLKPVTHDCWDRDVQLNLCPEGRRKRRKVRCRPWTSEDSLKRPSGRMASFKTSVTELQRARDVHSTWISKDGVEVQVWRFRTVGVMPSRPASAVHSPGLCVLRPNSQCLHLLVEGHSHGGVVFPCRWPGHQLTPELGEGGQRPDCRRCLTPQGAGMEGRHHPAQGLGGVSGRSRCSQSGSSA